MISSVRRISRRISWLNLAAIAMIATGIVIAFVGHDTLRWAPPPVPPAWAASAHLPASTADPASHDSRHHATGPRPTRSSPVSIDIPAIKVHAKIIALGLNPNGTLAVPPLGNAGVTSWYDKGPRPGQPGAAAILGHVDAARVGPAVFYELGNLRPGAKIYVRLRDGQTVVFEIYSVALYQKTQFPTAKVFGYTSWPTLRLITCGGVFDQRSGHYLGNVVAFASYVGSLSRS
jgi:sortase (surface protein transpeptidase)